MKPISPGYKTTEFYVIAGVALCITGLAAFGKIDASSSIAQASMAIVYAVLRSTLKSKAAA